MAIAPKRSLGHRLYHNTWLALLRRLLVSTIIAGPFLLGGGYGFFVGGFPQWGSLVVLGVGTLLMIAGLYMSFTGIVPSPPLLPGENQLELRHPTMKPSYARLLFSLPFLGSAFYVWQYSESPYVYPFVLFIVGLFFFFKGAMRYLRNLHITYAVTDRRVVHMYRFLWLNTKEIPVSRIISISEARSFFEIVTGRGSVVVASGIGERQVIKIKDISDPGPVAESLRAMLPT
jgi:hypothetical protein